MNKSIGSSDMAETSHAQHYSDSPSTFLGVDFGKAKIGLAIADEETKMAFALTTLKNDKYFIEKLKEIVESRNVKIIVMGTTWHEKDQESSDAKNSFAQKLEKEVGIAIMFHDEMFTTKMAHQNIKLRGGKNIAASDDQEAARIILQSWLDRSAKSCSHES